jgi:17beta-estradiol 17-dehydrogenase / very-long-chain 3-oxoacyl-CoA reductase
MLSEALIRNTLQGVGLAYLCFSCFRILDFWALWLLPKVSLSRYQREGRRSWALVTGASAGIGLGCAQELAARGFNVVLLGHKSDELREAQDLIVAESPDAQVRVLVLDAITASTADLERAIDSISDLNVTILVNNVGGNPILATPIFRRLDEYTAEEVDRVLFVNSRFMSQLSRIMIPRLVKNGPSLILNMGSGSKMGMPGVAMYSGSKAFVLSLSNAMAREMKADNLPIDVLGLEPGDVKTQSNYTGLQPFSPDQRRFAKTIMDRAGTAVSRGMIQMSPWPVHAIQIVIFNAVPEWLSLRMIIDVFNKKRASGITLKED